MLWAEVGPIVLCKMFDNYYTYLGITLGNFISSNSDG